MVQERLGTTTTSHVVLIHGIGTISPVMWLLKWRLMRAGFHVHYWSYSSLFQSIESHSQRLNGDLTRQPFDSQRFHVVAHSMGCIICRSAMVRSPIANLDRVVWLAPPNGGSPIARFVSPILGKVVKPTRDLSDAADSYVNALEKPSGNGLAIIAAKYDWLVPENKSHLDRGEAFRSVHATHNSLLFSYSVASLVIRFLQVGRFSD